MRSLIASIACASAATMALAAGSVEHHVIASSVFVTDANREVSVYLPEGYADNEMLYPVLYFMHGAGGTNRRVFQNWFDRDVERMVASGEADPLIVVAPHLLDSDFVVTAASIPHQHVFDEVIPFVESTYRIDGRRERRGIGGYSKGGNEAVLFSLLRSDVFSVVGLFAPATWVGPRHDEAVARHDDSRYPLDFWTWYGTNDQFISVATFEKFIGFLEDHELSHVEHVTSGNHGPGHPETDLLLQFVSPRIGGPAPPPTAVDPSGKLATSWAALRSSVAK
jgi:enterochelin esterase-like enzyme